MSKVVSRLLKENSEIFTLFAILVTTIVLFTLVSGGSFLRTEFLSSMVFQLPTLGLLALAQMGPMLTGGIDLSIISIANLSGIVAALILTSMSGPTAILVAVIAALLTSLAAGSLNGLMVAFLEVSPIISTIGMMMFLRGISVIVTGGSTITGIPESFLYLSNGTIIGIPLPFIVFLGVVALFATLIVKSPHGLKAYMIGSNETATKFSGINTKLVIFRTYLLSGFIAGIASFIMLTRYNAAKAGTGFSFLLLTVLICVLGGISPDGGIGKVTGLLLAVVILQIISSGFTLIGLSSHLASSIWGATLIFSLFLNKLLPEENQ